MLVCRINWWLGTDSWFVILPLCNQPQSKFPLWYPEQTRGITHVIIVSIPQHPHFGIEKLHSGENFLDNFWLLEYLECHYKVGDVDNTLGSPILVRGGFGPKVRLHPNYAPFIQNYNIFGSNIWVNHLPFLYFLLSLIAWRVWW